MSNRMAETYVHQAVATARTTLGQRVGLAHARQETALHVEHATGKVGFLDGLGAFLDVVERFNDDDLVAASRCRGWTVGDVVVHVHLGLQDMLVGLVTPTTEAADTDAAS